QAPKAVARHLYQFKTGHAQLAAYLHRIGRRDTPLCRGCSEGAETAAHLLL
ncbi:hypothetical protein BGW36DRAFT_262775, partial [Talaromyces proteolyticus]